MVLPSSHASPTVHLTYPPSYFFSFPPSAEPQALIPPVSDHTFARPFSINPEVYNNALNVAIPISIALIYATTVTILNRINSQRQHQPWAFSKSLPFYLFVLSHNIFLAIFSAWTCLGMLNAYTQSWPGWEGEHGLVGVVDALCKIHGPRGLGSAATYSHDSSEWTFTDRTLKLLDRSPDSTDVGRIWNEGLAFYGWLFYVSKFYEIVDTFIVLAKGKKSSVLQIFHHAGAMMCMWAGIRYMSPPIWMFVLINSGLHALMYTYYTLGALTIQIPTILKKTLTTLQIVQFVFGTSYAVAHLFVAYSIPVSVPYVFIHNISSAIPKVTSTVSSAIISATATAGVGSWLKKAALRAAGEEGLAENVRNRQGETFGIDAIHAADVEKAQEEIRYRLEYQTIRCLDTSGEVFAILINALYLAPLTILFINFFIHNYIRRTRAASPPPDRKQITKDSSQDAIDNVEEAIREAMAERYNNNENDIPPNVKAKLENARANLKKGAGDLGSRASKTVQATNDSIKDRLQATKEQAGAKIDAAAKKFEGEAKNWNAEQKETKQNKAEPSHNNDPKGKAEEHKADDGKGGKAKDGKSNEAGDRKGSKVIDGKSSEAGDGKGSKVGDGKDSQAGGGRDGKAGGEVGGEAGNDIGDEEGDAEAEAYEVNPDVLQNEEEKKAEDEFQPNGL